MLASVESTTKIVVIDLLTIRVLMKRRMDIRTVENLMGLQLIKGSARLHVRNRQVGEALLLLSDVLVVEEWVIMLVNARVLIKNVSSV